MISALCWAVYVSTPSSTQLDFRFPASCAERQVKPNASCRAPRYQPRARDLSFVGHDEPYPLTHSISSSPHPYGSLPFSLSPSLSHTPSAMFPLLLISYLISSQRTSDSFTFNLCCSITSPYPPPPHLHPFTLRFIKRKRSGTVRTHASPCNATGPPLVCMQDISIYDRMQGLMRDTEY